MVLTTIRLTKQGVVPPVYLAGTFTQWVALEMEHETGDESDDIQHTFNRTVDCQPGQHQYKFRLGPGDWWITDDSAPTGM